jgi:hypothetical protein
VLILVAVGWYHIGRAVAGLFVRDADPDLRDSIAIGLGMAILSFAVMLLGYLHLMTSLYLWLLIIIPFILTLPLTLKRIRGIPGRLRIWNSEFHTKGDRILWAILGVLALFDLINAGNAAVGWDAAVHHYAFPKAILRAGALIDVPGIPFSYYPELGEMLFTLGLSTGGVLAAGAMTWIYLFPLGGSMVALGKKLGNPSVGLWALVIFLGAPLTFELPFSGVIDLPFLTYCILALALLLDSNRKASWPKLILIGILTGCACATKHLGLLYLTAFIPIVIWVGISRGNGTWRSIGAAVVVALFALIIPLPWFLRSWHLTGDPLYPFLGNLLQLAGSQTGSFSLESFGRTEYPRSIVTFIGYLWHLTMDYWDLRPWYLAVHPIWLALLPPALVWTFAPMRDTTRRKEIGAFRILIVLALLTMAINFQLAPAYPRYLFPTWICLSLVSAWTLSEIYRIWPRAGRMMVPILILLPFVIVLAMAAKRTVEVIPQFWSSTARVDAIEASFPGYETFHYANETLDPRSSLILSIDPKIYYLDAPAIIGKPGIESPLIVPWDSEPSEIIASWRELDVTHFILDTTLTSVKHGFGIAFFTSVLGDRDAIWLDIETTRAGAEEYGIGDILTDTEFLEMSSLGGLPVVYDGTREGRHLLTRESAEMFQSWGRDWLMARTLLQFIEAGILVEEFRSGPGGGLRLYSIHLPPSDNYLLPALPDVTEWGLDYEAGPYLEYERREEN